MTDAPALRFAGVAFTYPSAADPALTDIDLAIPEGHLVLVTGPTGSGKSTFLRMANGLVPHFSGGTFIGTVHAEGRNTLDAAPRELADVVAFVPQDPAASFVLDRVEDELAYGMENLGVDPTAMRRRVEEVLDLMAIANLRNRSVRTLSGGEQQRVAIAAALAAGPRILVLDEPTSQLDPQGAEDVLAALQRLVHDLGMTVLISEHRLERVAGFADTAIGLPGDATAFAGTTADVLALLGSGPPVTRLGRAVGWDPAPLTVRDARILASSITLPEPTRPATPASGEVLLTCEALEAGYHDTPVLSGIDLKLHRGEAVALLGRNGSGKTTLLRALAGLHAPSAGRVRVQTGRTPTTGIDVAYCPQDPDLLLFADSVEGEVRATLDARGTTRGTTRGTARRTQGAREVLGLVGIGSLADRHPRDLSAGQRMLVATAAIIASGAPVLLLDEPTRGLDPDSKAILARFIAGYTGAGNAVAFATHDVELAAAVATRAVMIAEGEVIADGGTAEVLGDSAVFAPQMSRVFGPGWLTPQQVEAAMS